MDIRKARKIAKMVQSGDVVEYSVACAAYNRLVHGVMNCPIERFQSDKNMARSLIVAARSGMWGNVKLASEHLSY